MTLKNMWFGFIIFVVPFIKFINSKNCIFKEKFSYNDIKTLKFKLWISKIKVLNVMRIMIILRLELTLLNETLYTYNLIMKLWWSIYLGIILWSSWYNTLPLWIQVQFSIGIMFPLFTKKRLKFPKKWLSHWMFHVRIKLHLNNFFIC